MEHNLDRHIILSDLLISERPQIRKSMGNLPICYSFADIDNVDTKVLCV